MSALRDRQSEFAINVAYLLFYAYSLGYEVTFGDAWARDGHVAGSQHYKRLAIDLNLFRRNVFLPTTEAHQELGEYWERLSPFCRWGGKFKRKDGNHYEMIV